MSFIVAASSRKRLDTRLPPLGSRVCILVPPCGFRGGRNGVWVGFSRGFSRFPLPQISFHHFSTLISSISFHFISPWWCVRRGRPAPLLFTDLQYRGFITSHPSTRPCVGHELRIFIYLCLLLRNLAPTISFVSPNTQYKTIVVTIETRLYSSEFIFLILK